jgi:hypothetical protein
MQKLGITYQITSEFGQVARNSSEIFSKNSDSEQVTFVFASLLPTLLSQSQITKKPLFAISQNNSRLHKPL